MLRRADRRFELPHESNMWWLVPPIALLHIPLLLLMVPHPRIATPVAPSAAVPLPHGYEVALRAMGRNPRLRITLPRRVVSAPVPGSIARSGSRFPSTAPATASNPRQSETLATRLGNAVVPPTVAVDSPPGGSRVTPRYGNGTLWLRPMLHSPREIAAALKRRTGTEVDDSLVTAMVQAYLDQMAADHSIDAPPLPKWTTTIGGKTVGLDQRWIYLGPLKVPTALLAMLPIRIQANPTEAEYNTRLQQMRADLFEAARRTATYQEFKDAVKALHDQRERQREFDRNQRTPPDEDL